MHNEIKHVLSQLREGNSLRGDMTTEVVNLLKRVHEFFQGSQDTRVIDLLHSITQKQQIIMDQNAALSSALDKLSTDISAELQAIAGLVEPGMTDDQATALVARINALDASVVAALPAAAPAPAAE